MVPIAQEPAAACPNPASTTVIKCVFWGGILSTDMAVNQGQWRNDFHVVIAGSNGYNAILKAPLDGFEAPTYLDAAAINAPSESNSYMGVKIFTDGPFDPQLCAAACRAQTEYNLEHPDADGSSEFCEFFNTYLLLKNGIVEAQYCALVSVPRTDD